MFETLAFQDQFVAAADQPTDLQAILARKAAIADPGERAEQRAEDERLAQFEANREAQAFAFRQQGIGSGDLFRLQQETAAARDEVADLQVQLSRAQARLERAQGHVGELARRMSQASELVSRSAPVGLADAAAHVRKAEADARVDAMLMASRARREAAAAVAVRSDAGAGGGTIFRTYNAGFRVS